MSRRVPECHPDRKHSSHGLCNACACAARYRANKAAHRAASIAWRAANPDRVRSMYEAWKIRTGYISTARVVAWRAANPERNKASRRAENHKRRSSIAASTPHPATAKQRAALVAPGEMCLYCDVAQAVHVDHFIPIARWSEVQLTPQQRADGPDHISNLVGACAACNLSKNDRLPDVEWTGRKC